MALSSRARMIVAGLAAVFLGLIDIIFTIANHVARSENRTLIDLEIRTIGLPASIGVKLVEAWGCSTLGCMIPAWAIGLSIYFLLGSTIYFVYSKLRNIKKS